MREKERVKQGYGISKWLFILFFHHKGKKMFCKEGFSFLGLYCSHREAQIRIAFFWIGEKLYLQMT